MKFLVTGAAGFIGYHVSKRLLHDNFDVVGIDNLNNYYDVKLKKDRINQLTDYNNFTFYKQDLTDQKNIAALFLNEQFERVIHLGAQSGVRYSLKDPLSYLNSNLIGYLNILEGCRNNHVDHLLYASSSSVYGLNNNIPFSTEDHTDHPISFYAATKKSNELMAHTYSHLYKLPTTGLRLFNVYGPWGRPDMAIFKFTKAILAGQYIDVYNYGNMQRDFTYIDDVIEIIIRLQDIIPITNNNWNIKINSIATSSAPYQIYNIGNNQSVNLIEYIYSIESHLGIKAKKNMLPNQPGDILRTSADTSALYKIINFIPHVSITEGTKRFIDWYRSYYL